MVRLLPRVTVDSCFVVVGSGLGLSLVVVAGLTGLLGYLLWVFLVCGSGFLFSLVVLGMISNLCCCCGGFINLKTNFSAGLMFFMVFGKLIFIVDYTVL